MGLALTERDHKHIFHPCSQMKDYEKFKPLEVVSASGCKIELVNGIKIIDAISSWWCKSLGHNHPRIKQALLRQIEKFEHVILANTTNETIVRLSEKLSHLTGSLDKVFYASDGSSAIDIAMKMSIHTRKIQKDNQRNLFVALENSYHGETIGALSASDVGIYREPYMSMLLPVQFISPLPYVQSTNNSLWNNCQPYWANIERDLQPLRNRITAILIEPIVQGAGGMKIYSQDFLKRLRTWTQQHNIHLIADEIMTGMGRTGKMLACEHAAIEPDFLCLGKGLTSGWLPLSAMLTKSAIYDLFYDDYASGKSFLHSHTHSGNALATTVALEVLQMMEEGNICQRSIMIGEIMRKYMQEVADNTGKLMNVRGIGAIVAADLICDPNRRVGFEVYQKAVELGALLRPVGNTIYWLPPLNIEIDVLAELKNITEKAILAVKF